VQDSLSNISKNHSAYLDSGKVVIKEGDGRIGLPDYAPYDCIHVGAAADEMPQELLNQLAPGGRMVIPVGK
jgi:protein-L-isoaspartate(D-aspartate) O-methyltransferase